MRRLMAELIQGRWSPARWQNSARSAVPAGPRHLALGLSRPISMMAVLDFGHDCEAVVWFSGIGQIWNPIAVPQTLGGGVGGIEHHMGRNALDLLQRLVEKVVVG